VNIKSIHVTSLVTASGNDQPFEGRFLGDPFVAVKCPGCGTLYPETVIKGIGEEAIRCATCDSDITPFTFTNGYTITFGEKVDVCITVPKEATEKNRTRWTTLYADTGSIQAKSNCYICTA
jgi:ribosomal protein S27E